MTVPTRWRPVTIPSSVSAQLPLPSTFTSPGLTWSTHPEFAQKTESYSRTLMDQALDLVRLKAMRLINQAFTSLSSHPTARTRGNRRILREPSFVELIMGDSGDRRNVTVAIKRACWRVLQGQRLLAGSVWSAAPTTIGFIWRCRNPVPGGAGHPVKNVRLQPPNLFSAESLFFGKLPKRR